jgi:hypothetical protein
MKLSSIVCASIVTLAAIAMSAEGAFAAASVQNNSKSNVKYNGTTPGPNANKPCPLCGEAQATTVNSSRSNIRNNLNIHDRCPNGEAPPCQTGTQGNAAPATTETPH